MSPVKSLRQELREANGNISDLWKSHKELAASMSEMCDQIAANKKNLSMMFDALTTLPSDSDEFHNQLDQIRKHI